MQFLFPYFLLASLAIIIPVIIHLFYFRKYKKVYFSNVSFLKSIQQTTQSRRKLREWLILAARCLAILMLVFAFAQPFFSIIKNHNGTSNYSLIYVDNSFSMDQQGDGKRLIDIARQRANEIILSTSDNGKLKLVTNDRDPSMINWMSKEEALNELSSIQTVPISIGLQEVYRKMSSDLNNLQNAQKSIYLVSDFQKSTFDINKFIDTGIQINLLPVQTAIRGNLYIDTCYFSEPIQQPGNTGKLVYIISNSGSSLQSAKPILKLDNNTKPLKSITISPGSSIKDSTEIGSIFSGWHSGTISISDAQVTFDDNYFFSWFTPEKNSVIVLNDNSTNPSLLKALQSSSLFEVNNIEYTQFRKGITDGHQLVVLNGLKNPPPELLQNIDNYLQSGGNIFIFPSANGNGLKSISNYFQLNIDSNPIKTKKEVGSINIYDETFKNVFVGKLDNVKLPVTTLQYDVNIKSARGAISLLSYKDGSPYMIRYPRQGGNIFLCVSPIDLNYNTLTEEGEILVPLLFKAAFNGNSHQVLSFVIGKNDHFQVPYVTNEQDAILKFIGPQTFVPEQLVRNRIITINTGKEKIVPGVYDLTNRTGNLLGKYAFNYNRIESNMETVSAEVLENLKSDNVAILTGEKQNNLASVIATQEQGKILWKVFLLLSLLFLLIEILLIRLLK